MIDAGFLVTIMIFIIYYLLVLIVEKNIIQDPKEILEKFLSVILLYAGVSLIYFALTGNPLFNDSPETYSIYIFIIGFIAVLWTVPHLLEKFYFFRRFTRKGKRRQGVRK